MENNTKFNDSYGGVFGYDGNVADDWAVWNSAYSTANPTALIAPGQGFFVAASATGPVNVTFLPAMRSAGTTGNFDDFIPLRVAEINVALSKLHLSDGSLDYKTDVYFIDGTTRGLNPGYDTGAYQGSSSGVFTHLVEDNSDVELAIQSLPYNDFNDVIVPLGVKSDAGVQLTLGLDAASTTIPSNINVYLEDNGANTWTLLNTGDYIFTPSVALSGTGRFFVHYSSTTLSLEENQWNSLHIYTTTSPKALFVKGRLNNFTTANLYDITGRLILSKILDHNSILNGIDISTINTGIYIVKLQTSEKIKTQKVIIR